MKKAAPMSLKNCAVLAVAGLVAACNTPGGISREHTAAIGIDTLSVRNGMGYSLVDNVSLADAFIQMPERVARPIRIDERVWKNGIQQFIALGADARVTGENRIETRLVSRAPVSDQVEDLETHSLNAAEVRKQFRTAFPGRPFSVDPSLHHNAYGSFAFSFFEPRAGMGCMFGWQNVEATTTGHKHRTAATWFQDFRRSDRNATLSYRIRFCGQGFKWSDAVNVMKSVRLNVPSDVFERERRFQWHNGSNFSSGIAGNDPEDLQYVSSRPYGERREGLCAPGATLGSYGQFGSPCPVQDKPQATTQPKPAPKPVARPKPKPEAKPKAAAPKVEEPKAHPSVPLPSPSRPLPVDPNTPVARSPLPAPAVAPAATALPEIKPLQPGIAQQPVQPAVQPVIQPRIIPITAQPQPVPPAGQQVMIQPVVQPVIPVAATAAPAADANGNPMVPLPN